MESHHHHHICLDLHWWVWCACWDGQPWYGQCKHRWQYIHQHQHSSISPFCQLSWKFASVVHIRCHWRKCIGNHWPARCRWSTLSATTRTGGNCVWTPSQGMLLLGSMWAICLFSTNDHWVMFTVIVSCLSFACIHELRSQANEPSL